MSEATAWEVAGGLAALLATDILLPIPSGPLMVAAGARLGVGVASLAAWIGLMLGGVAAFALARHFGRPLAERFSSPSDLDHAGERVRRHDIWVLVATRPLPILAEATVLFLGVNRTPWRRFLPTLALSNAALAGAHAWLGQQAAENEILMVALFLSIAAPLCALRLLRPRAQRQFRGQKNRDSVE